MLLIVKMLDQETLTWLYKYSQSLGMESLVEVNSAEEMERAAMLGKAGYTDTNHSSLLIETGAKIIGVNNRDLTSFEVYMETTTRLLKSVPEGAVLAALSGITGSQDVKPYIMNGIGVVLVGEAFMRANDVAKFIPELLSSRQGDGALKPAVQKQLLVKICGTRSAEAAVKAVKSGADLIGMIIVTGTKRCVSTEAALQISKAVHETSDPGCFGSSGSSATSASAEPKGPTISYFQHTAKYHLQHPNRAPLVGVFRNQTLDYILEQQRLLNLDVVQLQRSEPIEWASLVPCPVIHSFNPGNLELATRGHHSMPLLDSGAGGTGQKIGTEKVVQELKNDNELCIMLAGGLSPDNIADVVNELGSLKSQVVGVDVSSGVDTDGKQDLDKIKKFVAAAKSVELGS